MAGEEHRRAVIIFNLRAGMSPGEIVRRFNFKQSTVYDLKKKFDAFVAAGGAPDDFSVTRQPHQERMDAMGDAFIANVRRMVDDNPGRSMRSIARELNVSDSTVRKVVKKKLKRKSFALKKGQFMNAATKERRLEKAKKLFGRIKRPAERGALIFFSDEKNFTQDQKVNRKNNRWICEDRNDVPIVMSTKFPATVMVLGVISNEGDVMPPFFFPKGLKINADEYLKVMNDVVKPWMDTVAGGRHYIFQQDGAPAHNAKKTQDWLRENVPAFWGKEVWPPSSPDCNPLDYYLWGVLEKDINRRPYNTMDELKTAIIAAMAAVPREDVIRACKRFRGRLEDVIQAKGNFIEEK